MSRRIGSHVALISLAVVVWLAVPAPVHGQTLPDFVIRHGYADTVLVNGKIVSMDDASTSAQPGRIYQAMAIKGDTIARLGTNEEVRALAGKYTTVYDLNGRTVIPGIVEPHSHIYGRALRWLDRFGIESPEKVIRPVADPSLEQTQRILRDAITDAVSTMEPGQWLFVNMQAAPEAKGMLDLWGDTRRLTDRKTLDLFAPKNPVMVSPGNRNFLNSAAINELNETFPGYSASINESMHSDEIGVNAADIGWAGSQEVSVIRWELFLDHLNPNTLAQMLKLESEAFAALGVTTFSSRLQFPKIMSGYAALAGMKQMPIRFSAHYEVHRLPVDPKETRQLYRRTGVLQGIGDDYFWIDGVASERWDSHHPEGCTGPDIKGPAHLKERETCPKPGDLHWDTLTNAIRAGWRLKGIHSIGSEALRAFTRMYDNAIKNGWVTLEQVRQDMPTVEHCDLIGKAPDILAALKKYNIMMSCGPDLMEFNTTWVMDYLPFNEAEHMRTFMMPYKTWIEEGVNIVGQHYGSGAFSGQNRQPPFYIPWITMSRLARGWIWAPEEKIDRVQALKMWTRWSARYVKREDKIGSLEEGKWADLVVLDRDYFTIPENDILKIRPLMTVVGGKIVALNSALAAEFKTEPVGYQYDFKDEDIQWIYDELKAAKPWNGETIPPGKG